jgi:hypothetical protein
MNDSRFGLPVGGTMTLDSPSGGGTTLVAQLPLPEHAALEAEPGVEPHLGSPSR